MVVVGLDRLTYLYGSCEILDQVAHVTNLPLDTVQSRLVRPIGSLCITLSLLFLSGDSFCKSLARRCLVPGISSRLVCPTVCFVTRSGSFALAAVCLSKL